jgi:hypothetical protein
VRYDSEAFQFPSQAASTLPIMHRKAPAPVFTQKLGDRDPLLNTGY